MCNQTVSLVAAELERQGISTVTLALLRKVVEEVRPPRALFVPFPFGYALGKPNEPQLQHRVLAAAFALLQQPSGPVLADFPEEEVPTPLLQASSVQQHESVVELDAADEVTMLRAFYERWVQAHDGRWSADGSAWPS